MNDVNTVILTVMKDHKMKKADVARLFGVSPQAVNNKFKRGSWDISEVVKLLDHIGCRLVIESGEIKKYIF